MATCKLKRPLTAVMHVNTHFTNVYDPLTMALINSLKERNKPSVR